MFYYTQYSHQSITKGMTDPDDIDDPDTESLWGNRISTTTSIAAET